MRKILTILIILITIPVTILLVKKPQEIREKAAEGASSLLFESDFETGVIQCETCTPDGWYKNNYGIAGTIKVLPSSAAPTREGNYSVRVKIDKNGGYSGHSGNRRPRAELSAIRSGRNFQTQKEYWVGWSIYIPNETGFDALQGELLTQFKNITVPCDVSGSPANSLHLRDGRWFWVTNRTTEKCVRGNKIRTEINLGGAQKGRWTDFVARFYLSWENDGILQVWKDGKLVLDQVNQPSYYRNNNESYLKIGIYKPWWLDNPSDVTSQTFYFDSVRVYQGTNGYNVVAPPPSFPLSPGWNQITWPDIQDYTASSALVNINNDCGAGTSVTISRKKKDWWEEYVKNYGGENFNLQKNQNYFINVSKDCQWIP